jgi:hypothetical protein
MEDLVEVGVVDVCKDAEQLAIYVLHGRRERRGKVMAYKQANYISELTSTCRALELITCFGREGGFVD